MIVKGRQHDRRHHSRAKFAWPVMLCTNKNNLPGILKDISGSGLAITTNSLLKINEEVRIAIQVVGYDVVIKVTGVVVRAKVIKQDIYNPAIEIGIRFKQIIKEDLRYFTGNVVSAWKEVRDIFQEERETRPTKKNYYALPIITLTTILLFIIFTPSYINKTKTTKIDLASKSFQGETVRINLPQKKKQLTERKFFDYITINEVQNALHDAGYEPGLADGIWGERTRRALQTYQKNNNLSITGQIDQNTLMALGIFRETPENVDPKPEIKSDSKPEKQVASRVQHDSSVNPTEYTLGPGDLITISVLEAEDLNTKVRVSLKGFISLPLLNQVNVQGLTANQAKNKIETLLRENYMHDPHVTLSLTRDDSTMGSSNVTD